MSIIHKFVTMLILFIYNIIPCMKNVILILFSLLFDFVLRYIISSIGAYEFYLVHNVLAVMM